MLELEKDSAFERKFKVWIEQKMAVTNLPLDEIIRPFEMARLRDSVEQYALHEQNSKFIVNKIWKDNGPTFGSMFSKPIPHAKEFLRDFYASEVPPALLKSQTLLKAAGPQLQGGLESLKKMVSNAIQIAEARDIEAALLVEAKQRELTVQSQLLNMDFSFGARVGDTFYLRLGSGTTDDLHVPIHEFLHSLSNHMTKKTLGSDLNEGLTEHLTLIIMQEAGMTCKRPCYPRERQEVQTLIEYLKSQGFDEMTFYQGFFSFLNARPGLMDAIEDFRAGKTKKSSSNSSTSLTSTSSSTFSYVNVGDLGGPVCIPPEKL